MFECLNGYILLNFGILASLVEVVANKVAMNKTNFTLC